MNTTPPHPAAGAGPRWPYPTWVAHRGAGKRAPENTLAAFRAGAALGWRMFECDAKLSADGVPFLLHDDTLERTTDGRGVAGDLAWAQLQRLDAGSWHSAAFAGEPIPSLEAVAGFVQPGGHALNIEIKPTPGLEAATGRVVAGTAGWLWAGHAVPPLLSSFKPAALAGAREAAPGLPRALLLDHLRPDWLDEARALGCVAVVARHSLIDASMVQAIHVAGMRVATYTVNEAQEARRLLDLGVSSLITDAVDRFEPVDGALVLRG